MQVSVENTGSLSRKMTIALPAQDIAGKVSGKMQDLKRQVRLKGFRPGKVPMTVIEKRFGSQVRAEVVDELVNQSFQQALSQENLRVASAPQIDAQLPEPDVDFTFTAEFDVFPELESLDLADLELEKPVAEVADADVDNMIETLRRQRQGWDEVERPAETGDLVFFHFRFAGDGFTFPEEGEERAGAIIGNGAFSEVVEAELSGMAVEQEKTATVTLSDEFRMQELAGKSGEMTLRVEKIQSPSLPEVDDDFIATFGVTEGGIEQFRSEVRDNLNRELKQTVSRVMRAGVMNRLVEKFPDLEVPPSMITQEQQAMAQAAQRQQQQAGIADAAAPDPAGFAEAATRRVKAAMLVSEVARHNKLSVDGTRVQQTIQEIASTYEDPAAVVNLYYSDENLLNNVQNLVLEEQAVDCVLSQAKVTENAVSFDELMNRASNGESA